jgi:hypothetical protein
MTINLDELNRQLRAGDPVATDPGLSSAEAAHLRRVMLAAADSQPARAPRIAMLALASVFTLAVVFGVAAARKTGTVPAAGPASSTGDIAMSARVTQVHFSTPGGTRIIWTIDPAFRFKEAK